MVKPWVTTSNRKVHVGFTGTFEDTRPFEILFGVLGSNLKFDWTEPVEEVL